MKHLSLVRRRDGRVQVTRLDLKRMMRGVDGDVVLEPDDIVYVPNSGVRTAADIAEKASIAAGAAAVLAWGRN